MINNGDSEPFRAQGRQQGDAFGASLAELSEQSAISRIQSLRAVILAGKKTLREDGCSPEQAQSWAEGYVEGFDPHARAWFEARGASAPQI